MDALEELMRRCREEYHKVEYRDLVELRQQLSAAPAQPAQTKTNQCGETCERAKLCAICARGIEPEQASKPMTEREIWDSDAIMEVNAYAQIAFENIVRFVRAVERFHKIGGE